MKALWFIYPFCSISMIVGALIAFHAVRGIVKARAINNWPIVNARLTKCEFKRDGTFIGYCMRWPNITNAWFTRDSNSLVSLHEDGALIHWNLSNANEDGAISEKSITMTPSLLKSQLVKPLNSEDAYAIVENSGQIVRRTLRELVDAKQ